MYLRRQHFVFFSTYLCVTKWSAECGLKDNLQNWGYQAIIALDETDAIQRTQGGREHFDLILLNQTGQSIDELIALGQQIRKSTALDNRTPIIIMAEQYGEDLEGQDIQVGDNEYVSYLEDGQQLKVIVQRLCPVYWGFDFTRAAMVLTNSSGLTGLARCRWNPAAIACW